MTVDGTRAATSDDEQDRGEELDCHRHRVCAGRGVGVCAAKSTSAPERHDWLLGVMGKELGMPRPKTGLARGGRGMAHLQSSPGAVRPLTGAASPLRRPVLTLAN